MIHVLSPTFQGLLIQKKLLLYALFSYMDPDDYTHFFLSYQLNNLPIFLIFLDIFMAYKIKLSHHILHVIIHKPSLSTEK